jgi:CDP-glycerol glycerophosphotransferase (TagB/SpsB family)
MIVASFSFGAGNAAQLLRIPAYVLGALAVRVIPRSRDQWVFGCGAGVTDGALALWRQVTADGRPAMWLTGSPRDDADARALGIPYVRKSSLRGFWRTARARVVVVTHGFGDANRYAVAGAFTVQLWHGIPLKRIGLDSPETLRSSILPRSRVVRAVLKLMYTRATRRIDLLPAASHLVRGRLESAFALPDERVPVTGEPRTDVLTADGAEPSEDRARARIVDAVGPLPTPGSRLVLYAPTWRDGDPDPAVPTGQEWDALLAVLDACDAVLLVRSHPLGAGDYTPPHGSARVRAFGSDLVRDATPALPGLDALITDYSSMAFDAALVALPVLYFAPDAEAYARRRGFYGRYEQVAGPDFARTWDEATAQLATLLTDPAEQERRSALSRALSLRVHAFRDGGSTRRVYRAIVERAGLPAATRGAGRADAGAEGTTA